ncbi:SRPBCC domain-containing protein [Streptomyces sp. NPDC088354]|uniref:SRPBCC domain-containing protein n=1 Tax=Streptomyces sp. NPDC088354 TaxID=3365856 RepID=UPI0037F9D711
MYSTQVSRRVRATPAAVYRVLLDPRAVARWRVPDGMSGHVHAFEAREGGRFRVSLVYDGQQAEGKSDAHTDTYHGYFARLVPDELVVEVVEFESDDAALRGTMTMTTSLTAVDGGTDVVVVHEGIPDVVPREDNETGTRMALDHLARLVEGAGGE